MASRQAAWRPGQRVTQVVARDLPIRRQAARPPGIRRWHPASGPALFASAVPRSLCASARIRLEGAAPPASGQPLPASGRERPRTNFPSYDVRCNFPRSPPAHAETAIRYCSSIVVGRGTATAEHAHAIAISVITASFAPGHRCTMSAASQANRWTSRPWGRTYTGPPAPARPPAPSRLPEPE